MENFVEFYVNGKFYKAFGREVFKPLSDFLRQNLFLTGTKEVCCEGDCGACTVLLGKLTKKHIVYSPVNSCILYVYQIDACHVITVEGLNYFQKLNPIQESLVKNHGTQCGFCTPGFVNSLYDYFDKLDSAKQPEKKDIKKALTGNLCRCTGYEAIIKSALEVTPCCVKKINDLYPDINLPPAQTIKIVSENRTYIKPITLKEALRYRSEYKKAKTLAGGTDLQVLANKQAIKPEIILDISDVEELKTFKVDKNYITIGAGITITQAERLLKPHYPVFSAFLEYYASPQIKNIATLSGNIANASPVGDTIPFFMVTDSVVQVAGINAKRQISMNKFFRSYKQTDVQDDEIIAAIKIPLPKTNETIKLYKISKRKHLDISTFSAAFKIKINNDIIENFSAAMGGVAPYPVRLYYIEKILTGLKFSENSFMEAAKFLGQEISPISDLRGTKEYRLSVAKNILLKFYDELCPQ
jgi:xanthine dehydrogenase small subunit